MLSLFARQLAMHRLSERVRDFHVTTGVASSSAIPTMRLPITSLQTQPGVEALNRRPEANKTYRT